MLGKKSRLGGSSPEKGEIKAFLGAGTRIEGKMVFDGIVRLDGTFRGEISSSATLIVGPTADVQAEIQVGTLILSGRFRGNIRATQKVELRAPAQVEAAIDSPKLMVEEGVMLNGTMSMDREEILAESNGQEG